MINEQDKQRIEKEARQQRLPLGVPPSAIYRWGYIAGATAEHELLTPQLEYANSTIKKFSAELERSEKLHKEEEVKAEQNAFHLVKALDLLDECHYYLKANPPDKSKMTYNKWESLIEETDYMREFNSEAEYERINGSEKLLQEYRETTKELILLIDETQVWMNDKGWDALKKAKSLLHQPNRAI